LISVDTEIRKTAETLLMLFTVGECSRHLEIVPFFSPAFFSNSLIVIPRRSAALFTFS
jgi:hypothetical protein